MRDVQASKTFTTDNSKQKLQAIFDAGEEKVNAVTHEKKRRKLGKSEQEEDSESILNEVDLPKKPKSQKEETQAIR